MQNGEVVPLEDKNATVEAIYADEYRSAYRKHVHKLLAWGYADSRHRVQVKQEEPDITGFIAEAIKDRLNDPDSPSWCDTIGIADDPPIPGEGRVGRGRRRPDLVFERTGRRPRPMYYFEAKRLYKSQSVKDYFGKDGLGCFIRGAYAQECSEAGMLGYIQSEDIDIWKWKLHVAMEKDFKTKNEILLLSPQCNIQIIDDFPQEWMSHHNRLTGKSIVIHHILLNYCIIASTDPTPM
jgi:hypothetical protein